MSFLRLAGHACSVTLGMQVMALLVCHVGPEYNISSIGWTVLIFQTFMATRKRTIVHLSESLDCSSHAIVWLAFAVALVYSHFSSGASIRLNCTLSDP